MGPVDFVNGDAFEEIEALSKALFGPAWDAWDEADDDEEEEEKG